MSGSKPLLALFSLGWREAVGVTAFIIDRAMVRKLLQWIADLLKRSHPLHVGPGKLACVGLAQHRRSSARSPFATDHKLLTKACEDHCDDVAVIYQDETGVQTLLRWAAREHKTVDKVTTYRVFSGMPASSTGGGAGSRGGLAAAARKLGAMGNATLRSRLPSLTQADTPTMPRPTPIPMPARLTAALGSNVRRAFGRPAPQVKRVGPRGPVLAAADKRARRAL